MLQTQMRITVTKKLQMKSSLTSLMMVTLASSIGIQTINGFASYVK